MAKKPPAGISFDELLARQDEFFAPAPSEKGKKRARAADGGGARPAPAAPASASASSGGGGRAVVRGGAAACAPPAADADAGDASSEEDWASGGVAKHRAELEALKAKDPAFYQYMQNNASTLLGFGDDDEEEEAEEAGGAEEVEGEGEGDNDREAEDGATGSCAAPPRRRGAADDEEGPAVLTLALARRILASAFTARSARGLAAAARAFRACCYMAESAELAAVLGLSGGGGGGGGGGAAAGRGKGGRASNKGGQGRLDRDGRAALATAAAAAARPAKPLHYRVHSTAVFMAVVTAVVREAPGALLEGGRVTGGGGPLGERAGWAAVAPVARSLLNCLLHLLGMTRDARLLLFLLRAAARWVPLLQPFPIAQRKFLRVALASWAAPPGANDGVRLSAYLRLRQFATALPFPAVDAVLKGAYLAFARACRSALTETSAVRARAPPPPHPPPNPCEPAAR